VRLHVHSYGDPSAPPVVCVHGVTGHGERFRRLAEERLADRHVVAVDLRGHGRSGYEPPWNLETHVDDLLETFDGDRAPWVGFSFGGRLCAELAHRHPDRVERLVLLDPALELPPSGAYDAAEDERTVKTFADADEAIQARYDSGSVISTPREYLEEEMRQHLVETGDGRLAFRYSRSAAVGAWGEMARPAVAIAQLPTLLVLGTESYVPNDAQRGRYRDALGDGLRLVELRSGHSVLWDAFEETADAVTSFLGA
jgi:lipase